MKKLVIIIGPPRSGTSLVSHVINKFGVYFGEYDHFIDPKKYQHNPIFFELESINKLNDEIFEYFNKSWYIPNWFPDWDDFSDEVFQNFFPLIKNIYKQELQNKKLIGIKDPRFCYTLPLWVRAFEELDFEIKYIQTFRDPNNVIQSYFKLSRNRILAIKQFVQSSLLADHFLKRFDYLKISYDNLLSYPYNEIKKICDYLDLPEEMIPYAIEVIDINLNHQKKNNEILFNFDSNLNNKILSKDIDYYQYKEIFDLLQSEINDLYNQLELTNKDREILFTYQSELLKDRNLLIQYRDELLKDRNLLIQYRDELLKDRNLLILSQDKLLKERDSYQNEKIYKLVKMISKIFRRSI